MRYVEIEFVKAGMILGKTLYGEMGEVLLREGTVILENYIPRIRYLGYFGVYVEDSLSEGICVEELISEELKIKTIKAVKNMMKVNSSNVKDMQKSFESIEDLMGNIVDQITSNKDLMINMIDLKVASNYTFYHSVNVTVLSLVIGIGMKLSPEDLYLLGMAALLHDVGKMFVSNDIIEKNGPLTMEEFTEVKKHPLEGYNYVKEKLTTHTKTYMGILTHHERVDGTGYPSRLKGDEISEFGRIIAVADVYDALTSDRPYRKRVNPSEAMEYVMGGGGTFFDINIVREFSKKIAPFPVGTCVSLTNNSVGIVMENYSECCLRPKIKIFKVNDRVVEPYLMDLKNSYFNVTIKGISDVLSTEFNTSA